MLAWVVDASVWNASCHENYMFTRVAWIAGPSHAWDKWPPGGKNPEFINTVVGCYLFHYIALKYYSSYVFLPGFQKLWIWFEILCFLPTPSCHQFTTSLTLRSYWTLPVTPDRLPTELSEITVLLPHGAFNALTASQIEISTQNILLTPELSVYLFYVFQFRCQ